MARRKDQSLLDVALDFSSTLPIWANALLALGAFVALRYFGGEAQPTAYLARDGMLGYVGRLLAYYGQFIVPVIFILGGCLGAIKRRGRTKLFNGVARAVDVSASVRNLKWDEFERLTAEAFARMGYASQETRKGRDGGVDCVLLKNGLLYLVQCKHWNTGKVGVKVVRELNGVVAAMGAAGGFVVCSGEFTAGAKSFAQESSIELVDGRKLARWFAGAGAGAGAGDNQKAVEPGSCAPTPAVVAQQPVCPRCGSPMVGRHQKTYSGSIAAPMFLGCINFPKCRGTRSLA